MRIKPADVVTAVLVGCALVVTALLVRREVVGTAAPPAFREVIRSLELETGGSTVGSADAPLRIVEFSDFQCPSCARAQEGLRAILERHPGQVAVAYRHLPLSDIHPHATDAALASECAGEQGRFEQYHDHLFTAQDSIGTTSWASFAARAGVGDLPGFDRCLGERRHVGRLATDSALAAGLGIRGTPVFVFQGRLLAGAASPEVLAEWVDEALSQTAPRP